MELTDRKKQILKIVTEEYIRSAEPIGSKAIAQQMPGKISSATIRNELADLVEMGYLEQPHTSAGRVPSAKGYRLYVNELMEHRTVSGEEAEKITSALGGQMKQLDQVVAQAGQMASSLMGYPAYAVADHKRAVTVQRFELIAVSDDSFIAVVMLSDSRVKSQLMHLQLQVEPEHLRQVSNLLNTHFTGISAPEMNGCLMNLSDQVKGQWFLLLNQVVEYAGELLAQAQTQQVFTGGASQILKFPEYRDADKAHELMSFISDSKENLPMPTGGASMQILIGPENVSDALKDSSVVIASYDIGAGPCGRGGPHPYGLCHSGGSPQLLCREPQPYVWKTPGVTSGRGEENMSEKKKKDIPQEQPKPEESTPETPVEETPQVPEAEETFTVTRQQMEQFESLAKLLSDGNDKYLRLAAEYDNYRKRTTKEKESIYADAKLETVKPFLDVADNLDRAVTQFEEGDPHRQGMELICKQFAAVLEKLGVTEIEALGQPFDPEKHNAVMHIDDESLAENTVAEVFRKGYQMGDRVVRFAMVKVAN